jgi:peptidyl-prolyl cis-trans isomerase SurA
MAASNMPAPTLSYHYERLHLRIALCALVSFTAACGAGQRSSTVTVSDDAWAVIDGREIKRDEVEKAYRRSRDVSKPLSDEEALTAKLSLLNEIIVQDILLAKARDLKLELPESELDTAYAEARKNMPEQAFQQELSRRSLTAADMREGLRRELLVQKLLEQQVGSKVAVSDQEVADFFNANRAQFNVPEEAYHLAQIAVTPVRDAQSANRTGDDAATQQAADAKIGMLLERLKGGASFRDLAMDYSEDPESAPRGGDLGYVPVSRLKQVPPRLRDAVLKTKPGAISVVNVGGAHTIVLVVAHEPAGQRDLSMPAVRERITETLRGRKEQLLGTTPRSSITLRAGWSTRRARCRASSPRRRSAGKSTSPGGRSAALAFYLYKDRLRRCDSLRAAAGCPTPELF